MRVMAALGTEVTMTEVERTTFVGFVDAAVTVIEGDDEHALLRLARHGCLDGELHVQYATREDTAKAGQDFTQTEGTLKFAPGETSATIKVPIIDDDDIEDDESFFMALSNPWVEGLPEGAPKVHPRLAGPKLVSECEIIIKDDDKLPGTIGWKESAVRVIESDRFITLTVERRRGHNGEVSVRYDTKPREALEGTDYIGQHGEMKFAHGAPCSPIIVFFRTTRRDRYAHRPPSVHTVLVACACCRHK